MIRPLFQAFLFSLISFAAIQCSHSETLDSWIQKAGNEDSDKERLEILKSLRQSDDLPHNLVPDLDALIAAIDKYETNPRLDYFGPTVFKEQDYPFGVPEDSPFYPLTHLYRGRMRVWVILEYGGINKEYEVRRAWYDLARKEFEKYLDHFPNNRIAKMYLGEPFPPEKEYTAPENAPAWAVAQRESLERLTDIIHWWIDNRLQENGEYGGGWGDDCEMWRWWVPALIAFEDPKMIDAQSFFTRSLMSQEHMKRGYTDHVFDVEHTAEDSADAITPMMHLEPDNPEWSKMALRLADLFENLWTGVNERGFLQFKSTYFSVDEVSDDPRKACDTVYHPRAVQPALLYWQRTGDPRLAELFSKWMNTWVDITAREEKGKPKGIIPSAIHWPDGQVGGIEGPWWDPHNHSADPLYVWPSAMSMMTESLLLTYHMTGDEKYLEPLKSMARIRLEYGDGYGNAKPGSAEWCSTKLRSLSSVGAKFHFLTGEDDFDELIERDGGAYVQYRLGGDLKPLEKELAETAEAFRTNYPGYTSEVRYTDRVLRFPAVFGSNGIHPDADPNIKTPNPSLLYSTLTGDPGDVGYFPMNAVRWLTEPRDFAALVNEARDDRFSAELYHFGENQRELEIEFFLLAPGRYQWSVMSDGNPKGSLANGILDIQKERNRLAIRLPARQLCHLQVNAGP
ncbi:MAG: hypothetical protein KC940_10300 [Candidatus Omnitrophica bacterium]|nr:hypothetical protein [Candidatus Omnitrophota bacterium]